MNEVIYAPENDVNGIIIIGKINIIKKLWLDHTSSDINSDVKL